MAELVNVSPSTICRELQRNTGKKGYRCKQAQLKSKNRRKLTAKPLKMTIGAIDLIDAKAARQHRLGTWAGFRGLKEAEGLVVSHERIYQHIWTGKLNGGVL